MTATLRSRKVVLFFALVFAGGIFLVDVITPLGVADWLLYLVPIAIVGLWSKRSYLYLVGSICILLILLGYFLSPSDIAPSLAAYNRILQIVIVLVSVGMLAQYQQQVEKSRADQERLEQLVKARTAALEQEVVERKQAEEALRDSEQRYRLLADNAVDLVWTMDAGGKLTYISPSVQRLRGYSPEEVLQQPFDEMLTPDSAIVAKAQITEALAHALVGEPVASGPYVFELTCKDGSTIFTETIGTPLYDESGSFGGILAATRDITERRRLEHKLRLSEQKFAKAFDANPAGVTISTQADGRYLEANSAYLQIVGYNRDELIGHTSIELGIIEAAERAELMRKFVTSDAVRYADTRLVTKAGRTVDVITSIEQIELEGVACILSMTVDISERKRMEKALREINDELERRVAERTAALEAAVVDLERSSKMKDEFMAMVSHELRTPLTGILGLADSLEEQISGTLTPRQIHQVQLIHESGDRLLELVNGILSYTRLMAGAISLERGPCELDEVLAISERQVARPSLSTSSRRFNLSLSRLIWVIMSDVGAIHQVLTRLLENAIKFTPIGGKIGLEARSGSTEDTVQLIVWDTGAGIRDDQLELIFQPFTQGDSRLTRHYEGIGLGLAYVREMVLLLGGTIAVLSTPGEGSRFTVTLPRYPGSNTNEQN